MEISDEKRRAIAASLRESREFISGLPKVSLGQNAFDTFERILACVDYEQGNIFDYLANLIDRPTCRDIGGEEGTNGEHHDFFCISCGYAADLTEPNYCPNCGAEVIE